MFGATLALGLLAALSVGVAVLRLLESWHVGTSHRAHAITIAGQRFSYPVANSAAIVVVVLAALGLAMSVAALLRLGREVRGDRRFRQRLRRGAQRRLHGAWVLEDDRPQAFCAGLLRPRVYVSNGALELLDEQALAAVLAHERHHARNRDPLRLACGRALVAGMLFVPPLRRLVQRQHALSEIGADDAARAEGVERSALAAAMLSFSEAAGAGPVGIDPERVDNLLGEPPEWRFPVLLCVLTAVVLIALIALIVLAGRVASGSATLAPPFLSGQPCIVVLALLPAAALAAGAARLRGWRAAALIGA
jgi:bla regulator protein blaR1